MIVAMGGLARRAWLVTLVLVTFALVLNTPRFSRLAPALVVVILLFGYLCVALFRAERF